MTAERYSSGQDELLGFGDQPAQGGVGGPHQADQASDVRPGHAGAVPSLVEAAGDGGAHALAGGHHVGDVVGREGGRPTAAEPGQGAGQRAAGVAHGASGQHVAVVAGRA